MGKYEEQLSARLDKGKAERLAQAAQAKHKTKQARIKRANANAKFKLSIADQREKNLRAVLAFLKAKKKHRASRTSVNKFMIDLGMSPYERERMFDELERGGHCGVWDGLHPRWHTPITYYCLDEIDLH